MGLASHTCVTAPILQDFFNLIKFFCNTAQRHNSEPNTVGFIGWMNLSLSPRARASGLASYTGVTALILQDFLNPIKFLCNAAQRSPPLHATSDVSVDAILSLMFILNGESCPPYLGIPILWLALRS